MGRKPVLAKFKDDLSDVLYGERYRGMWTVMRHEGVDDDGYSYGWGFAGPLGVDGIEDRCFELFLPLPKPDPKTSTDMEQGNILDDFAIETPLGPETLRSYVKKHPTLALELTDLYQELRMADLSETEQEGE